MHYCFANMWLVLHRYLIAGENCGAIPTSRYYYVSTFSLPTDDKAVPAPIPNSQIPAWISHRGFACCNSDMAVEKLSQDRPQDEY